MRDVQSYLFWAWLFSYFRLVRKNNGIRVGRYTGVVLRLGQKDNVLMRSSAMNWGKELLIMLHGQVPADICCPIALLFSMGERGLGSFSSTLECSLSLVGFALMDVAPSAELCPSPAQLRITYDITLLSNTALESTLAPTIPHTPTQASTFLGLDISIYSLLTPPFCSVQPPMSSHISTRAQQVL